MTKSSLAFILLSALCIKLKYGQAQQSSKAPCHDKKGAYPGSCEVVTLPKGLCGSCTFGDITSNGLYVDCTRTMDLEAEPMMTRCTEKMEEYVALNPCDAPRKDLLEQFKNSADPVVKEQAREALDYFLYSMCEQGCDCIPQDGAVFAKPTYSVYRGNCPAHARYDICRIMPNVKLVRSQDSLSSDDDFLVSSLPPVCPLVVDWHKSNKNNWTQQVTTTMVTKELAYFLDRAVDATEMVEDPRHWKQCFQLESYQDRLLNFDNTPAVSDIWIDKAEDENYTARHESSFVQAGDKFYMIGGRETRQVDRYDYASDTWDQAAEIPKDFNNFQATEFQGLVWVIGAFQVNGYPDEIPAEYIWVYDPAHDVWMQGPNIPSERQRGSAGLVVINDKFYVIGGNTKGHAVAWLDEYNPATGKWVSLQDAPHARDHFTAVAVGDEIYCVGGRASEQPKVFDNEVAEIDVYDIGSSTWFTLDETLAEPRAGTASVYFAGNILLIGGENTSHSQAFGRVDALDPVSGKITEVASMVHPRQGTQAIVSGDGVYIAGGSPKRGGGTQRNMEVYNQDQPAGNPSIAGVLEGPAAAVSFNITNKFTKASLRHVSGNIGVFVNNMTISGPDADKFLLKEKTPNNFLIFQGEEREIAISYMGLNVEATAQLVITYSNTETVLVELTSSLASSMSPAPTASPIETLPPTPQPMTPQPVPEEESPCAYKREPCQTSDNCCNERHICWRNKCRKCRKWGRICQSGIQCCSGSCIYGYCWW